MVNKRKIDVLCVCETKKGVFVKQRREKEVIYFNEVGPDFINVVVEYT